MYEGGSRIVMGMDNTITPEDIYYQDQSYSEECVIFFV
jgi:guanyl-specific ribonuclease Sa